MSQKKGLSLCSITILVGLMIAGFFFGIAPVQAADGSGTNTVTPTSTDIGTTGNTFTFTFTAAETMDSGGISITSPTGWSAAQGTAGTAGYTTVSTTGMVATVKNNADSLTVPAAWTKNKCGSIALSSTVKHEGTNSVLCGNFNSTVGNSWYIKPAAAENWSGYTRVGFWINPSKDIPAGALTFSFDNANNLGSPIENIALPAIASSTWTYVTANFTLAASTRTSVLSYGWRSAANTFNGSNIYIDDLLIGPGVPTFPGSGVVDIRIVSLGSAQTITTTYGSGGGASGVTAPATVGTYTATTTSRFDDSGALTNIASHPTLTAKYPTPTLTSISPTSATVNGSGFTMYATGTNFMTGKTVLQFNGSDRVTTVDSATTLHATIPASDLTTVGAFNITAFNPTPGGGTSTAQTFTVNKANVAIALGSSLNPSTFGQSVTFTATTTSGAGTPTGTVTFKDGGTTLATSTMTGGVATLSTSSLSVATHSITATYNGDTNFNASTSAALSQTVNKANIVITLGSSLNPSNFGDTITFTATTTAISGTPTGTVTFKDGGVSIATSTMTNGVATLATSALSVGTHSITATYNGDANFNASTSAAVSQTVNKANVAIALGSSLNPSTFGTSVTFTATTTSGVGTPTGTVTFLDGGTALATSTLSSGVATLATSSLSVGTHSITATYNGDTNFNASTSAAVSQVVNKTAVTITLGSSLNPSTFGTSVTFTATTTAVSGTPTGTVTFKDGGVSIATSTMTNGVATFATTSMNVGTHSMTAVYNGDATFSASTSAALSQTVNKANVAIALGSSLNPSIFGTSVTFTATTTSGVGTPSGTVTFFDGAAALATSTMTNGVLTYSTSALSAATHSITATYNGDTNFNASTSAALSQVVNNPVPTITTFSPASANAGGGAFTLTINGTNFIANTTATFNGSSKAVTFASSTQITIPITAGDIAIEGTSTITVTNPTPGGGTATSTNFTVVSRATKLVISGSPYAGTVDAPIQITIQAQKANNSIDTNFSGSVSLVLHSTTTYATTSNNVVTITNGTGTYALTDHVAEMVFLSLLDTASTSLDVTSTGTAVFEAGTVTRFTLAHSGDVPQFERKEFVVGRLDQFSNAVSATSTLVYLYASPTTPSGSFYNAPTGSTTLSSITILPGSTSTSVWYGNGVLGTYLITVSDNASTPDGAAGIVDATNTIAVTPVATNMQIMDPGNGTTDGPLTVRVEVHDDNGTIVTSYSGSATLVASSTSGLATVASGGMLNIVNGVATTTVTDIRSESVTLSLTGTPLVATSTRTVSFAVGQFAKLNVSGSASATAGTLSALTLERADAHDNLITSGGITITLAATPTTTPGTFYVTNSTSSGAVSATSIVGGQASTTVYYYNEAAGSYQLTFTSGAVSNSASIAITASAITQFALAGVSSTTNPGGRLQLTVSRKDQFNNLVSAGSTIVYPYASPTSSSTAFYAVPSGGTPVTNVTIDPGSSTKDLWYYETVTGAYTITVSDNATAPDGNTGIIDASVPVNVQISTATQFVFDTPNPQTIVAGSSTVVTIKAKDAFGNVDTSYNNGVTLVTGVSSVTAPGMTNGQVLVTIQNGVGTISLTDTIAETVNMALSDTQGTGLNASSTATATWIPGPTAKFILTDLSPVGTFIVSSSTRQYMITRRDQYNNYVTTGTDLAYLYSNSSGASFRPTQASTTTIPFVTIAGSATSSTFWYFDTVIGTWDITASNNPSGPSGLNGFIIGHVQIDVVAAPIVATKYVIVIPTGVQAGQTATVVIKAVDDNGFTQIDYNDFVNLIVSTSSANVPGLANNKVQIHIVNGTGNVSVMDPVTETIHLALEIPSFATSTLNASSTADLIFLAVISVSTPTVSSVGVAAGGGGGTFGMTQSSASFTGKAFPGAQVVLFAKTSAGDIPVKRALDVAADGTFKIDFTGILNGLQAFGITITDPKSNVAQTKVYGLNPVTGFTGVSNISIPPTSTFVRKTVAFGNNVGLNGYGTPGSTIKVRVDGQPVDVTAKVQRDGTYKLLVNTYGLTYGPHILQTQQISPNGVASEFSTQGVFTVTKTLIAGADMNSNGKVDIGDISIFLSNFNSTDPAVKNLDDLNGDGKVDISDLSIFLRAAASSAQ